MQKALEERGIEVKSANLERVAISTAEVNEEQAADVFKLIDKLLFNIQLKTNHHLINLSTIYRLPVLNHLPTLFAIPFLLRYTLRTKETIQMLTWLCFYSHRRRLPTHCTI